tara:strand:+ start:121 stop:516 length:396 start_codon:yes stop_codon:yes gene_type:complete
MRRGQCLQGVAITSKRLILMTNTTEIYKITFLNKGKVYEVFVKQVYQSDLYGFIEIEEFLFDERSQVVVDPSEEKLKAEFSGVRRSFIPIQAIIRIDEVEKSGVAKISSGDNITPFPVSLVGSTKTDNQDV